MQQDNSEKMSAPPKENMKARTFTAIGYVLVLVGLIALKACVPNDYGAIGFDVLFWLISLIGAFEFMRAMNCISRTQWWCVMVTCALIIPTFVITKMAKEAQDDPQAWLPPLLVLMSVCSLGAMVTAAMLVFDFDNSNLKSTTASLFCILYCGVLCSVSSNINHMDSNSLVAVTLMFFITIAVDTFALLFGKMFGRFLPYKLAPHTSPNKTIIGFVGGIIGGILAAIVVWGIGCGLEPFRLVYFGNLHPLAILVLISIPTSILAQIGDLFESAIKRGCGIKDMGRLLPGHGGILDRFDSMLFASVAIVVCFIVIR
ncbi:MAG TPA: phosphatidate cytidylyltransferase [Candidatus Coproplasma excrementipullorum]|nr:phosphatidate cytidylyltransferase [Candidatus Coproplasma excrementipullorum]